MSKKPSPAAKRPATPKDVFRAEASAYFDAFLAEKGARESTPEEKKDAEKMAGLLRAFMAPRS